MAKSGFSGRLEAGAYAVEARSLGRNDRLDYALTLRAKELQPGRPRRVTLPATIPFAIAEERVVSLTTFGEIDVRAVLRDGEGRVIERIDDRTDDWNVALSRRLPAGAYTLELSALPGVKAAGEDDERESPSSASDGADVRTEPASDAPVESGFDDDVVEVALSLPAAGDAKELRFEGVGQAEGPHVHRFSLPAPVAGSLLVIAARGTGELVLSLERQEPDGSWMTRGLDRGKSPLVAAPAETDGRPWRVSAWVVDGGVAGDLGRRAGRDAPGAAPWRCRPRPGDARHRRGSGLRRPRGGAGLRPRGPFRRGRERARRLDSGAGARAGRSSRRAAVRSPVAREPRRPQGERRSGRTGGGPTRSESRRGRGRASPAETRPSRHSPALAGRLDLWPARPRGGTWDGRRSRQRPCPRRRRTPADLECATPKPCACRSRH